MTGRQANIDDFILSDFTLRLQCDLLPIVGRIARVCLRGRAEKTPHWVEWGENNEERIENGLRLS